MGAIVSDLCEWHGWTVEYVLRAPFAHMMLMYDYACEKHYGKKVPRGAINDKAKLDAVKSRIEEAEKRARRKDGRL